MKTFLKAQLSSLIATAVDFTVSILLVEIFGLDYLAVSVAAGAVFGAITNFIINRYWTFEAKEKRVAKQSLRYLLVWAGSLLLNVSGTYSLNHFFNLQYVLAKISVAVIVGLTFNYILQKKYVFAVI